MAPLSRKEKHSLATKKGLQESAAARRCPNCGRGAAIKRQLTDGFLLRVCRYCGYEKGRLL